MAKSNKYSQFGGFHTRPGAAIIEKYIDKATRFLKVNQYHSGFPEVFSNVGGVSELFIKRLGDDSFEVNFSFELPGGFSLFKEQKIVNYSELKRLADLYDKHQNQIDAELGGSEDSPVLKK